MEESAGLSAGTWPSAWHGAKNLRHDAENVRHHGKNVHHGAKNVQHGAKMCGMVPTFLHSYIPTFQYS